MKRILITGFEPFNEFKTNPSETLVYSLAEWFQKNSSHAIDMRILPVDYEKVGKWIDETDFSKYDFVFQFGVASGRHRVSLERVALNWTESKIPDNSGDHRRGHRIQDGLPEALFSELNLSQLVEELNSTFNNSIEVSFTAGGYLCNFAYFKARVKTINCLFIHIPSQLTWLEQEIIHTEKQYSETIFKIVTKVLDRIIQRT